MLRLPLWMTVLVFCVKLLYPAAAGATSINLLVNGSFENGPALGGLQDVDIAAGSYALQGWTIFAASAGGGAVDYVGTPWNVSHGQHAIDLDGRVALFSGVFQTFATVPGQRYDVAFDLSGNPGGEPLLKRVLVSVDSISKEYAHDSSGQTINSLVWDSAGFSFIASETSASLSFTSLTGVPNSYGAMIDNVRVYSAPDSGSSGVLMLAGLALLGALGRFTTAPRRTETIRPSTLGTP